ncbi:MAG: tetratricopeptide repeat-containing sensor histidine kinase [Bacteroidota bacterium]|nr:MAG: tetratricopeptide repeat-containing sensor histidine kinase [Bacteroidota bacterium]
MRRDFYIAESAKVAFLFLFISLFTAEAQEGNGEKQEMELNPVVLSPSQSNAQVSLRAIDNFSDLPDYFPRVSNAELNLQEQKLDEAIRTNNSYEIAQISLVIGEIVYNRGQYQLALKYFLEANTIGLQYRYPELESKAKNLIGKYYHTVGNFNEALDYYEGALKIAKKIHDTVQMISLYNNIGNHFTDNGEMMNGLHYCLKAYSIQQESIIDQASFSTTCNHLGNIYAALNDFENSMYYHHKALNTRRILQYDEGVGKSYLNLSKMHYQQNQFDSSEYYVREALILFNKVGYAKGTIKGLLHIGLLQQKKGLLNEAEDSWIKSKSLSENIGYTKGILQAQLNLAGLYKQKKEYSRAVENYHSCLEKAKEHKSNQVIRDCYLGLQVCYEYLGDYKQSNDAGLKYIQLSDTLLQEVYNQQIASLKATMENEKQLKQNELLRAENQVKTLQIKQKNLVILLFLMCFLLMTVLAMVSFSRYSKKHEANKMLTALNQELKMVNREKDKFFSIIAHELRNPLWWVKNITETLSGSFDKMTHAELSESLRSLDESARNTFLLMDNLLNWTRTKMDMIPFHPQNIDINNLVRQNVLLFQSPLKQKKIGFHFELCDSAPVFVDINLMNTALRNVFSNALKFTPNHGSIVISIRHEGNFVVLDIQDSGVGIDAQVVSALFDDDKLYSTLGLMQEKGSGIGLKLCKEFVEKNKGTIQINSKIHKGTRVIISLPASAMPASDDTISYAENQHALSY